MIIAENLSKTYYSKNTSCDALKNISFTLPDNGLVFILGKSGSGKSTLLNLLGALDSITSGDIIIDGAKYSLLDEKSADSIRNSAIGIVFQDFCLIEEINVKQNVALTLNLQGKNDNNERISELLASVDLDGLEYRYPKQLSAGQKQRVAIVRALAKDPRIIMADEPTGNLDNKSATLVLDILKKLSGDRLVIVVSHNVADAEKYADRIIELSDGEIIRDETRKKDYSDDIIISNEKIVLPYSKKLSEADLESINDVEKKSSGRVDISQNSSGFIQSDNNILASAVCDSLVPKRLGLKSILKYSAMFFKKRTIGAVISAVIISLLLIVFGMCQQFYNFNGDEQLANSLRADKVDKGVIISQGYYANEYAKQLSTDKLTAIDEETFAKLDESYDGKLYKMYVVDLPPTTSSEMTYGYSKLSSIAKINESPYIRQSNGTLVCDIEYLQKLYGDSDGNLKILAGEIPYDDKVIITDYLADAILFYEDLNVSSYDDIINVEYPRIPYNDYHVRVGAIIDTGYKQKYQNLYNQYVNKERINVSSDEVTEFFEEVCNYYSLLYSVNDNFLTDYSEKYTEEIRDMSFFKQRLCTLASGESSITKDFPTVYYREGISNNGVEISLPYYNELFKTEYTDVSEIPSEEYLGKEIVVSFRKTDNGENYFEKTLLLEGVHSSAAHWIHFPISNTVDAKDLKYNGCYAATLYTYDSNQALALAKLAEEQDMYMVGHRFELIRNTVNIVEVFRKVFKYIALFLCLTVFFILCANAISNVRRNAYNIGVVRAMGGRIYQLSLIFAIQTVAIGLLICVLTAIGNYLGVLLINNELMSSIESMLKTNIPDGFNIIVFEPLTLVLDLGIALAFTLATAVVPIFAVKKVKPLRIMRSGD